MSKPYAFEFLATRQWALEGEFLERMANVALREDFDPIGALEAKNGRRITQITEMRDGVAVIHVNGVVSRYANLFHAVCGGVSTEVLAKEFTSAVNEPSVKAVILNIDSPGGEASGIHELGEMIHASRGKKPIRAYVGGDGCSAAYWIATSCDRVTMDATARVGSIGTVVSFVKRPDGDGTKRYEFVSSQSPNKRLDPDSEQGQSAIQSQLDDMAEVFIQRVARNMNVNADKVKSDFGKGGVMIGQRAVDAGMAHELGSLEALITSLSKGRSSQPTKTQATANPTGQQAAHWLALDDTQPESIVKAIREQYPEAVAMFEQQTETLSASAALDLAESVDLPMMARKLSSMTEEAAHRYIQQASSMRDTLAAAGLSGSFSTLAKHIEDPARLVGMAIHEAKALADEAGDLSRFVCDETPTVQGGYDQSEIYKRRNQK
ncbi:S49 family peptidase [Vibrio parahaemolyticus]|nr:S49 family peptidase [Vibrio parahaemolyticus]MBE4263368.1 S49 family peptidase [Vibrio parahaemolyticus]HCM0580688.1 S49 family peptidase [Vibrio parahaemolyticus]